jgi:hypothetical protein
MPHSTRVGHTTLAARLRSMSLLTVLLILAAFGIAFLLVLVTVIRIEIDREQAGRSLETPTDASVE